MPAKGLCTFDWITPRNVKFAKVVFKPAEGLCTFDVMMVSNNAGERALYFRLHAGHPLVDLVHVFRPAKGLGTFDYPRTLLFDDMMPAKRLYIFDQS